MLSGRFTGAADAHLSSPADCAPTGFSPLPSRHWQRNDIAHRPFLRMADFRWRPSRTPWYRRKGTDPAGLALLAVAILVLASLIWLVSD
jgi:hypothetical protein